MPGIAPLFPDAAAGDVLVDVLVLGDGAADPVHRIAQKLGHFTAARGKVNKASLSLSLSNSCT